MFSLRSHTPMEWVRVALADVNALLLDHAACERKAAAMGMSFVVKYPDRTEMIEPMIQFAREELEHFHQVSRIVLKRGLTLVPDTRDDYVNRLHKAVRSSRDERFLDRLLVASVVEARGTERLALIAEAIEDEELRPLYRRLTRAEDRHKDLFLGVAETYFPKIEVRARLAAFLDLEAEAIASVPFRSAIH